MMWYGLVSMHTGFLSRLLFGVMITFGSVVALSFFVTPLQAIRIVLGVLLVLLPGYCWSYVFVRERVAVKERFMVTAVCSILVVATGAYLMNALGPALSTVNIVIVLILLSVVGVGVTRFAPRIEKIRLDKTSQ